MRFAARLRESLARFMTTKNASDYMKMGLVT
jgi:hypothetical protein